MRYCVRRNIKTAALPFNNTVLWWLTRNAPGDGVAKTLGSPEKDPAFHNQSEHSRWTKEYTKKNFKIKRELWTRHNHT